MVSPWASLLRMLTLGTQSPHSKKTWIICGSMSRYSSWEPQLRSQVIGNVNCKLSDDSSHSLWPILDDAESSRDKLSLPNLSPVEIYEQINVWGWYVIQQKGNQNKFLTSDLLSSVTFEQQKCLICKLNFVCSQEQGRKCISRVSWSQ